MTGDISRLFIYYVGRKADLVNYNQGKKAVSDTGMTISGAINALQIKGEYAANFGLQVCVEELRAQSYLRIPRVSLVRGCRDFVIN